MLIKDYLANPSLYLEDIKRIKETNKEYNYLISDCKIQKTNTGKLANVAFIVKDNINLIGTKTTAASKMLENYQSIYTATVLENLLKEGAICLGKSNLDELAMGGTNKTSYFGPCLNAYDKKRISGGSSGGSAVATALGIGAFSIGTDTGDSIRKPASFNNIIGVKPTYGRISRYGVIPYASSLDHVGYFCNSVNDAAYLLEIMASYDPKDHTSINETVKEYSKLLNVDLKGKTIAVLQDVIELIKDQNILNKFQFIIKKLKEKGAFIKEIRIDKKLLRALFPTYFIIANCEASSNHSNLDGLRFGINNQGQDYSATMINNRSAGFGSFVKTRFMIGSYGLYEENQEKIYRKAQKIRSLVIKEFEKIFKDCIALIAPASGGIAPLLNDDNRFSFDDHNLIVENYMVFANFTGSPSMTLPMGFSNDNPVGININAALFKEEDMFNVALAIEEILKEGEDHE